MKNKTNRITSLLIILALMMSLFAACTGGQKKSDTPPPAKTNDPGPAQDTGQDAQKPTGIDTSQRVELQFWMLGSAPNDLPLIEAEINKMALEELNTTVKFNYTTWTDWEQKYRLLLTAGNDADLIFTAEWTQYQQYAKAGAFLALDDLLPVAAPGLLEYVPDDYWEAVKIDGKIQTVPAIWKEYVTQGFAYREDLRKKYNLPIPTSVETLEEYMDGIKANEPQMIPIGVSNVQPILDLKYEPAAQVQDQGFPYGLYIPYDNPRDIRNYYGTPEHLEDLRMFKRWQDKGFLGRNVLSNQDTSIDLLRNGVSAVILGENPNRYNDSVINVASTHPDWELGYYGFPESKGYATPVHPIHNGFAIPKSSKHPERALAFYEKMVLDKRYNWLTQYGIEGTHFEVTDTGHYKMLGDAETNGFKRENMNGWAWRNPEYMLFDPSFDAVQEIFDHYDTMAAPDYWLGFAEDYSEYQAERAAFEQVVQEYLLPLNVGLKNNVEEAMNEFVAKAKAAGLDKIQEKFTEQWLQYLDEIGM